MQVGGTLRGTRAISLLIFLVLLIGYAYSSPLQYLPNIPGYVPVYIRYGDEPLEEINSDLAEAFGETSNSAKSLQKIDHTFAHESDGFKDEDINVFLEEESERKHDYPLRVRETESRSFATANNDEPGNPNKPKLLTIYELPDDNESRPRRRYRGRTRMKNWKPPAFKVSPLSDEEKEKLEKLAIEVEKEEIKPNELPNLKLSPSRTDNSYRAHDFIAPIKVQDLLNESLTNLPEIDEVTDFSKSSDYENAVSETDKKEPPIKEQRPATILSNVDKISPIDLPDESETSDKTKNSTEPTDEIATAL